MELTIPKQYRQPRRSLSNDIFGTPREKQTRSKF